jgi:hypothetical protein
MRHLVVLFIHLIAILTQLLQPGGVRSLVEESLLLKLLIVNRSRQRSPNLSSWDRILAGWMALLVRPARLLRSAIVLKPSTLLALRLLPYCFFDARVGEQPHDGDHNVAGAGDPRLHERQGNCRSVDHDRQRALSVISNRCRQR